MNSIGEQLRSARHEKQVSLEDVARVTRIKLDILEKLEADEFDRLVSPTYAKSFLKMYAEHLGLDAPALVQAYLQSQGGLRRQGLQVETVAATRARRPGELRLPVKRVVAAVAGMTLLVIVVLVAYSLWARWHQRQIEPRPAAALPTLDYEAAYTPKHIPVPDSLE